MIGDYRVGCKALKVNIQPMFCATSTTANFLYHSFNCHKNRLIGYTPRNFFFFFCNNREFLLVRRNSSALAAKKRTLTRAEGRFGKQDALNQQSVYEPSFSFLRSNLVESKPRFVYLYPSACKGPLW